MSASLSAPGRIEVWPLLRRYLPLVLLLATTALLGFTGQSVARPLFLLGCVALSWDLMRFGPSAHFEGCFALFCLAPLLRRVVDVYAGYEPTGLMISGPLLAIAVPAPWLVVSLASGRRRDPTLRTVLRPFLLAFACVLYGVLLTMMDGNVTQAASNAVKWLAPVIYGMWLCEAARTDGEAVTAPAGMAMLLMPLLGIYGLLQYLDPPIWDRYWMSYTTIASIGQPEPYLVRVFSTMNAPAGYATFTAASLLLFGWGRVRLRLLLAAAPCVVGLLLTTYRTAWIALAVGIVLCLFDRRTRGRALVLLLAIPLLGVPVVAFTPAGGLIEQRLESLTAISQDQSGQERLAEYGGLLSADEGTLIGHGFGDTDVMQPGATAQDGQLVVAWHSFGLVVGLISVAAILWAGWQGMRRAWRSESLSGLAAAAVMAGLLVQIPLAVIGASEIGFLFWSLAAVGAVAPMGQGQRMMMAEEGPGRHA